MNDSDRTWCDDISDDWGETQDAPCRVATIKALGYEAQVIPVEGQSTTVWFRKP